LGQEDFTTWTEIGVVARLSQTADRSTFTGLRRTDANTLLYDTKTGQLQNFTYYFKFRLTNITSDAKTIRVHPLSVLEDKKDYRTLQNNSKKQFGLQIRSTNSTTVFWFVLYESTSLASSWFAAGAANKTKNTDYYVKLTKAGTALNVKIYSDAAFTNQIESLSLTLHANYNLPYLACPQSIGMATDIPMSGYMENLTDVLLTDGSANLNAEFEVRHSGSEDLTAVFETSSSGSADLKGIFIVRHSGSLDFKGLFEIDHIAQLSAEATNLCRIHIPGNSKYLRELHNAGHKESLR